MCQTTLGSRLAAVSGSFVTLALALCVPAANLSAQRNRVLAPIDAGRRVTLRGHIHPKALAEFDQAPVDASQTIPYMTLASSRMLLRPTIIIG